MPLPNFLTHFSGARHLYLTDYDPTNLPDLKSTIDNTYPDVKVCLFWSLQSCHLTLSLKVTVQQADAADEDAVARLCKQALHDEGRLDVFFANVCIILLFYPSTTSHVS